MSAQDAGRRRSVQRSRSPSRPAEPEPLRAKVYGIAWAKACGLACGAYPPFGGHSGEYRQHGGGVFSGPLNRRGSAPFTLRDKKPFKLRYAFYDVRGIAVFYLRALAVAVKHAYAVDPHVLRGVEVKVAVAHHYGAVF